MANRTLATVSCLAALAVTPHAQAQALDQPPSAAPAAGGPQGVTSGAQSTAAGVVQSINDPSRFWALRLHAELGFVGVMSHIIQLSQNNSEFNYVTEGGQDTLLPFARFSAEIELAKRHQIILLYQPLDIRTVAAPRRDLRISNTMFRAGQAIDFRYGFDFYRASYMYDFIASPQHELSFGLSLQIRNANIDFTAVDGSARTTNHNIGPVPILKARGRYGFRNGAFLGFEVDGFWASGRFITGSADDFEGAICDASLRAGLHAFGPSEVYVNLRYIGGGARGQQSNVGGSGDGFTNNWLHTMALSIGATLR
ncbi:MAG: hypothetical protein Q8Q09_25455 [Deltaproteobacteria bacterium]|nr:hypothetical protein [Deltaproteobacteria bacterium]